MLTEKQNNSSKPNNTNTSDQALIPSSSTTYFYKLLEDLIGREAILDSKMVRAEEIYTMFLEEVCKEAKQYFGSNYERAIYVIDRFQLPEPMSKRLKGLGILLKNLGKATYDDKDFERTLEALTELIGFIGKTEVPEKLRTFYKEVAEFLAPIYETIPETADVLDTVVVHVSEMLQTKKDQRSYFFIICQSEKFGALKVAVWEDLSYLQRLIWKYARINFVDIVAETRYFQNEPNPKKEEKDENDKNAETTEYENLPIYSTSNDSLIILDPDYLFDATTIRQGYCRGGEDSKVYIARKFEISQPNYYFLRGSVVNDYLDYLIAGQEVSTAELAEAYLQKKPSIALFIDPDDMEKLDAETVDHYTTLKKKFLPAYKDLPLRLEPTFISPIYGLRGRLDILVEYPDEPDRQDVIELKTSRDPIKYHKSTYEYDSAQAICYNLLLNTLNKNQRGSSSILYSKPYDNHNPLRNVPNDTYNKRKILRLRNGIVTLEYRLCKNPSNMLNVVRPESVKRQLWDNERTLLRTFAWLRQNATPLEIAYFDSFIKFVSNEKRAVKVGTRNSGRPGFSALWNHSLAQKERRFAILSDLAFESVATIDGKIKITLSKTPKTLKVTVFRKGDIVLLYPQEKTGKCNPTTHQIIKGTIETLEEKKIVFKSLNPHINEDYFSGHDQWVIEQELIDRSFDSMYNSLMKFLTAPKRKRQILLGLDAPTFKNNQATKKYLGDLTDWQKQILNQALSAENYFLLQGPPGTGKTSYMLREMVFQLLQNKEERLLLLAYTNRAVDEICKALLSIEPKIDFYRLGSSATTAHPEELLSTKIKGKSLSEIEHLLRNNRVYVATVLGIQSYWEFFDKLKFTTAIIDEASQLLEPQLIGILSSIDRFILIGDEKQLPAVVVQSHKPIPSENEHLQSIGLNFLTNSLFERLIKKSEKEGWNASGMLKEQGRMHELIQAFPNVSFYGENLKVINPKTQAIPLEKNLDQASNPLLQKLGLKRTLFVESPVSSRHKVHDWEANFIVNLIDELLVYYPPEDIGVITPYRAQIGELKLQLGHEKASKVSIDTVERYQGSQRPVIIVSFSVSHAKELDFLVVADESGTVDRKLNVALTRAKELLILVGCKTVLETHPIYEGLLNHYIENELFWPLIEENTSDTKQTKEKKEDYGFDLPF